MRSASCNSFGIMKTRVSCLLLLAFAIASYCGAQDGRAFFGIAQHTINGDAKSSQRAAWSAVAGIGIRDSLSPMVTLNFDIGLSPATYRIEHEAKQYSANRLLFVTHALVGLRLSEPGADRAEFLAGPYLTNDLSGQTALGPVQLSSLSGGATIGVQAVQERWGLLLLYAQPLVDAQVRGPGTRVAMASVSLLRTF